VAGIRPALALPLAAWLLAGLTTGVDGTLPTAPYRYLQPPPTLNRKNVPPTSAERVLPPEYTQSVNWNAFTPDDQAGIVVRRSAIAIAPGAVGIVVRITPVAAPSGLPPGVVPDGNAYRIEVKEEPSERTAGLRQPVLVSLRWPHTPLGMYLYHSGRWSRVCDTAGATLTASAISCPTRTLGIVAAVMSPAIAGSPPATGTSAVSALGSYLWLVAGLCLLVICGALLYRASRNRVRGGA
jgi:hypothetical protein